jgi:hypothetical protein
MTPNDNDKGTHLAVVGTKANAAVDDIATITPNDKICFIIVLL